MLGTFKMIWDWLYSFFGWNRHAIYNWNQLRMSRKGSLGGALPSFCAYVPKWTLMMYTFFHRDNGTRNLTSVILLKPRPKLHPNGGTIFCEISKISQGSVPRRTKSQYVSRTFTFSKILNPTEILYEKFIPCLLFY